MRDTCVCQSLLVLVNALLLSDSSYTGTNALMKCVNASYFESVVPCNIYTSSKFVFGLVAIGVTASLLFKNIQCYMANNW